VIPLIAGRAARLAARVAGYALWALALLAPPVRAATPLTYVALGDSTAVGMGAPQGGGYPQRVARRIEAAGFPVKLVNLGVPGANAADLRRDQLGKAVSSGPALVTICIGINDVVQGRSLNDFARDLEVVADSLRHTKASVVISNLPDLAQSPSAATLPKGFGRRLLQYNAVIQTVAERHGFQLADAYAASRRAIRASGVAASFAADGFHPSALGYDAWTEAIWPSVERALGPKPRARRASAPGPP
jgi:lysophospholipase L1-like esterase